MRKEKGTGAITLIAAICLLVACKDSKKQVTAGDEPTEISTDTLATDTIAMPDEPKDSVENIIAATPMPKAADELFDDFFFNFSANEKLQMERVNFPLAVNDHGEKSVVAAKEWKMEPFFTDQGFYTLIFDSEKQMEVVKDTTVSHVVVEKVFLDQKQVEQFVFNREEGLWKLTEIDRHALLKNANSDFLNFYDKFSKDSLFQVQSLNAPVKTVIPDPEDDFNMLEGEFYPEQWQDFKPEVLPQGFIYNIQYGQPCKGGARKIFVIRGISNSLEIEMTFLLKGGEWRLVKLI